MSYIKFKELTKYFDFKEETNPFDLPDYTKEYVDKANNDIQRIQEAKSEAIENANRVIEEYNRNVRGY